MQKQHRCATCKFRRYAENNPDKLLARFWRWHTTWCPGWKAYMQSLAQTNPQTKERSGPEKGGSA